MENFMLGIPTTRVHYSAAHLVFLKDYFNIYTAKLDIIIRLRICTPQKGLLTTNNSSKITMHDSVHLYGAGKICIYHLPAATVFISVYKTNTHIPFPNL